jgi:hypothetical protein
VTLCAFEAFFWYFAWFTIFVEWGEASDIHTYPLKRGEIVCQRCEWRNGRK